MDEQQNTAWTKLYHPPTGALVTLPIPLSGLDLKQAQSLFDGVSLLGAVGFVVNQPGLEDGEHSDQIGFVVRRSKVNSKDKTETPVVDLYPVRGNFRLIGVYLNTSEDVKAFESACGVSLDTITLYEGDNTIERGKNPKMDKYIRALSEPAKVVWKYNDKWEGKDDKKNPRRLFVRWDSTIAPPAPLFENKSNLHPDTVEKWGVLIKQAVGVGLSGMNFNLDETDTPKTVSDRVIAIKSAIADKQKPAKADIF